MTEVSAEKSAFHAVNDNENGDDDDDRDCHNAGTRKREMFRFQTNWLISSIAWQNESSDESLNLALCSFIEEYDNQIQLVSLARDSLDEELSSVKSFEHPYPATKALFAPSKLSQQLRSSNDSGFANSRQLLATTADYLRIWKINKSQQQTSYVTFDANGDNKSCVDVQLECLLSNNKNSKYCAPLTSFDWNEIEPSMIVTSSVDTICTIWDIEYGKSVGDTTLAATQATVQHKSGPQLSTGSEASSKQLSCTIRTQVIAHDREVYDVSFSRASSGKEVFISSGADGTVRMFDLRHLKRSTVLFEAPQGPNGKSNSVARVSCNKQNPHYVSAFAFNSNEVQIIDIRNPGRPATTLLNHTDSVNCMSWAPHSTYHIATASSDKQALIYDLLKLPEPIQEPLLVYGANGQVNAINWSPTQQEWIAVAYKNCLELLRI